MKKTFPYILLLAFMVFGTNDETTVTAAQSMKNGISRKAETKKNKKKKLMRFKKKRNSIRKNRKWDGKSTIKSDEMSKKSKTGSVQPIKPETDDKRDNQISINVGTPAKEDTKPEETEQTSPLIQKVEEAAPVEQKSWVKRVGEKLYEHKGKVALGTAAALGGGALLAAGYGPAIVGAASSFGSYVKDLIVPTTPPSGKGTPSQNLIVLKTPPFGKVTPSQDPMPKEFVFPKTPPTCATSTTLELTSRLGHAAKKLGITEKSLGNAAKSLGNAVEPLLKAGHNMLKEVDKMP